MAFLYDILKNSTIVDNQNYTVTNGVLSNNRTGKIVLESVNRRTQIRHKNEEVYDFLYENGKHINANLKKNKKETLVLFNTKEYEHNSDDNFYDLVGHNWGDFNLKTGNIIGYVKKGDYQLKISSRFGDNFLKYIIADADGFIELKNFGANNNQNGYEWLLIYLWKIKLKKAFRLGLPKQYKSFNEKLNTVRGKIDVVDYFLNQKTGKYLCNYREHSYNNLTTKLITETFKKVKKNEFVKDLQSLKNAFTVATNGEKSKITELLQTPYFSNPFYSDYNSVIDLSKQILKNDYASFGSKSDNSSFLFDVSMLFEYYIRKLLSRNGFQLNYKFDNLKKIPTGSSGTYKRKLEPDILINTPKGSIVLDVKYKYYDFKYGVKREDLFQIHTYVGQYGNDKNILGCGFVFPIMKTKWDKLNNKTNSITSELEIMGNKIKFSVLFLIIPDESTEDNYNSIFKNSESNLINAINKIFL